jgi:uncharacterized protein YndB with AHSA1/START domain
MTSPQSADAIKKEILISAPAARVFEAITDPRQRVKWWGSPGKFQTTEMESDLRPGGAWVMRGSRIGGNPFTIRGIYRAVEPPHALETTWLADWEEHAAETIVRFDLIESGGATTVRLTHSGFTNEKSREYYQGWPWLLALLQAYVQENPAK